MTHFVEQWGELTNNKWILAIVLDGFRIPFRSTPPLSSFTISLSIFLPITGRRDRGTSPEMGSGKGTRSENSRLFLVPKKNGKFCLVIDLSQLNQYIRNTQLFKMEILVHYWTVSIDLIDAYLHVPIHPQSQKYLRFMFRGQVFRVMVLPFGMALSLDFYQTDGRYSIAPVSVRHPIVFVPRRLAYKSSNSQPANISHKILPPNYTKSRFHSKSKEVRFDTSPVIHVYRDGISDTAEYSQSSTRPSRFSTFDYQTFFLRLKFQHKLSFSFGQTQRSSRFHSPGQTTLPPASNVSFICLETSHSFRSTT